MTTNTKPCVCPHCHTFITAASHMRDDAAKPKPHDVTVCLACAGVCVFNDDLTLRKPLAGEIDMNDVELRKHVLAVKMLRGLA